MRRPLRWAPPLCALAALAATLPAGAGAQAPARACTAAELTGSRAPLSIEEGTEGSQPEFLVAGGSYMAVVVQELGKSKAGNVVEGSIKVTAPTAVKLTPATVDGRPAYRFKAPATGPLRFTVTWEIATASAGTCAASGNVDRTIRTPKLVRMGAPRFFQRPARQQGDSFALPILASSLTDTRTVTVLLRLRKDSTVPPPARGAATTRFFIHPDLSGDPLKVTGIPSRAFHPYVFVGLGPFLSGALRSAPRRTTYVEVSALRDFPVGKRFEFAFSVEVRQAGRRIGGMRAGASCVRVQGRGTTHTTCRRLRFSARP